MYTSLWGTTTNANIMKLFLLQKQNIILTCKVPYLSHAAQLFVKLRFVRVQSLYEYRIYCYYKQCTKDQDNALQNLANLKTNVAYNTRNSEEWQVAQCRTNYEKQMGRYQLPSLLNQLQRRNGVDIDKLSIKELRDACM